MSIGRLIDGYLEMTVLQDSVIHSSCVHHSVSDGMSRTGVFIAAMCEVERVKVEGEVDIFQTIKAMRKKRPHMVYNKVCTLTHLAITC